MNQLTTVDQAIDLINAQEEVFNNLAEIHKSVNFKTEAEFAIQLLRNNEFLLNAAKSNPSSLVDAINTVAAVGLSLCKAKKQAYLVPRDGKVILDISYKGLCDLATKSKSIKWVQAKIVMKNDEYESMGVGLKPNHKFNPFSKERGLKVGVYCVAKTGDDEFLTEEMSIKEVYYIRDKSSKSAKSKYSPWQTFPDEMVKKTCIRRASKLWPNMEGSQLEKAVGYLNQTEGINFDDPVYADVEDLKKLQSIIDSIDGDVETRLLKHLSDKYKKKVENLEQLTAEMAKYSIGFLSQFVKKDN